MIRRGHVHCSGGGERSRLRLGVCPWGSARMLPRSWKICVMELRGVGEKIDSLHVGNETKPCCTRPQTMTFPEGVDCSRGALLYPRCAVSGTQGHAIDGRFFVWTRRQHGLILLHRIARGCGRISCFTQCGLVSIGFQTVPDASYGLDAIIRASKFLPQSHDLHVNGPVRYRIIFSFDCFDDLITAEHPARVTGQ